MKNPKVGERVRVFDMTKEGPRAMDGKIKLVNADGSILILTDKSTSGDNAWMVHPKQCRRLIKKKRRRVWVVYFPGYGHSLAYATKEDAENAPSGPHEIVEFVEVKEKK